MHELSLADSLLKKVIEEARKSGSGRVKAIHARIAEGDHPMAAASLRSCLEMISQGTLAEGAELAIEVLPNTLRCRDCQSTFSAPGNALLCPRCHGARLEALEAEEVLEISVE